MNRDNNRFNNQERLALEHLQGIDMEQDIDFVDEIVCFADFSQGCIGLDKDDF